MFFRVSDRSLARFDLNIPKLLPRYGIHTAREAHDWFLSLMREQEEFEVETDMVGEAPLSFWSETVRQVGWWSRSSSNNRQLGGLRPGGWRLGSRER